jgi:hypothetical protein
LLISFLNPDIKYSLDCEVSSWSGLICVYFVLFQLLDGLRLAKVCMEQKLDANPRQRLLDALGLE